MSSQDQSLPGELTREQQLTRTFVDLADTLAASFDVHEFLSLLCRRTQQIVAVEAVGVLVEADQGELGLVAASNETAEAIDLFEAQARKGPCFEAYRDGTQVLEEDLTTAESRWPALCPWRRRRASGPCSRSRCGCATVGWGR